MNCDITIHRLVLNLSTVLQPLSSKHRRFCPSARVGRHVDMETAALLPIASNNESLTSHLLHCASHYPVCPPGGSLLPLQLPDWILWTTLSTRFSHHLSENILSLVVLYFIISLLSLYFLPLCLSLAHQRIILTAYCAPVIQFKIFRNFSALNLEQF